MASKLSDRLADIEKKLADKPGALRAKVPFRSDERAHSLEWNRISGTWKLWVWDVPNDEREAFDHGDEEGNPATGINGRQLITCSVDVKLAAAEALPLLFKEMRSAAAAQVERLKTAHATLDSIVTANEWGGV